VSAGVLVNIDINPPGSGRNIHNGHVVALKHWRIITVRGSGDGQINIGATEAGALDGLAMTAAVAVAVATTVTDGGTRVLVSTVDGGDSGSVGVATLAEIKVVVGVFTAETGTRRVRVHSSAHTGHGHTAGNVTMVNVVVQMMVLVLDHRLFDHS